MRKIVKIFTIAVIATIFFISCTPDINVQKDVPQDFNWDVTSYTQYSAVPSIGPDSIRFATNEFYPVRKPPYSDDGLSWAGMGMSLLTGCASGIGSFAVNKILTYAFSDLMQSDEVKLLNKVMTQLDKMDSKLDTLTSIAEDIYSAMGESELNDIVAAFNQVDLHLENFKRVNNFFYERLNNALAANASEDEIIDIVREWGKTSVNGTDAYIAAQNLASEILRFNYRYKGIPYNYCMVFDMIAFDSFPWECLGYDYREMYRAAAAAELTRCLYLSAAYYNSYNASASIESDIKPCAQMLAAFFDESKVVRHNDVAICQITGAHFSMDKDALVQRKGFTLKGKAAYMNSDQTITAEGEIHALPNKEEISAYLSSQLKDQEVQAIIGYYKAVHPYDYTFMDCLVEGGVKIPNEFNAHYTISPDGEVGTFDLILFGTADTKFYCHSQDPMFEYSDPIYFGIKDFYIVGVPVGGVLYLNVLSMKIPTVCGWKTAGELRDPDHYDLFTFTIDPNRSSTVKNGERYYNDWKMEDVPYYNYPDKVIMLKNGSLQRY